MTTEITTRKPRAKRKVSIQPPATTAHPFRDVMRAGVPLVQYETSDPAATIKTIVQVMNGEADTRPLLVWDILRGLVHLNEPGKTLASKLCGTLGPQSLSSPVAMLKKIDAEAAHMLNPLEENQGKRGAVVFMSNAHRFIDDVSVMQGVWNVRDRFKSAGAILVLLCTTGKTPLELRHDLVSLSDPLPGNAELQGILKRVCETAVKAGATFDAEEVSADGATVDTLTGLNAFAAEQTTAMSVRRDKLDMDTLWTRKVKQIEQTSGLTVVKSDERAEDLRGLDNLLGYVSRLVENSEVRCLLIIDEIEKSLAGATGAGDSSGTSQDQLGAILRFMQDENVSGLILVGHPGCGKSAVPKAVCNKYDIPLIGFDFGAMKGSLVGESEAKIRAALATVKAISNGKALIVATCNKITSLPPELRRRFSLGTFFSGLPEAAELAGIWRVWMTRCGLDMKQPIPNADGFTGAEVRACCDVAKRTGLTLAEAIKFIVPISKSSGDQVTALCRMASGNFISAHHGGTYEYNENGITTTDGSRKIQLH